jgi:hypothetical protein
MRLLKREQIIWNSAQEKRYIRSKKNRNLTRVEWRKSSCSINICQIPVEQHQEDVAVIISLFSSGVVFFAVIVGQAASLAFGKLMPLSGIKGSANMA